MNIIFKLSFLILVFIVSNTITYRTSSRRYVRVPDGPRVDQHSSSKDPESGSDAKQDSKATTELPPSENPQTGIDAKSEIGGAVEETVKRKLTRGRIGGSTIGNRNASARTNSDTEHRLHNFWGHGAWQAMTCDPGKFIVSWKVRTKHSNLGDSRYITGINLQCGVIGDSFSTQNIFAPKDFPDEVGGHKWEDPVSTYSGMNGNAVAMASYAPDNDYVKAVAFYEINHDAPGVQEINNTLPHKWTRIQPCSENDHAANSIQTIFARLGEHSPWVLRHIHMVCDEIPRVYCYPTEENETVIRYSNADNDDGKDLFQQVKIGGIPSGQSFNNTILTDTWEKANFDTWIYESQEVLYLTIDIPPRSVVTVRQIVGSCHKKKFFSNIGFIDTCITESKGETCTSKEVFFDELTK